MTEPLDVEAIRKREQAATKGPWGYTYDGSGDFSIGASADPQGERHASMYGSSRVRARVAEDAEFIAHARQDIPALLVALDAQSASIRQAIAQIDDYLNSETPPSFTTISRWRNELAALLSLRSGGKE